MPKTRVALFGGQDLGYVMADYFSRRTDIDLFVVTFQSRRDIINGYRSALTICRERRIPFIETTKPYEDTHAHLTSWQPDIIVAAYYARLFPPALLKIPRLGAVNAHPGKFPRYRGPMPTPWYILNGETTFGMGIFQIDDGIDTGPVFIQREYPIPENATGHELLRLTMDAAAELYKESFDAIISGNLVAKPQEGEPLFCPRIEPRHHIDWKSDRTSILRWIRVRAKPYFPAYTFIFNRMVLINRARPAAPAIAKARPGQILSASPNELVIACADGAIVAEELDICPALSAEEWPLHFVPGTVLT